MQTTLHSALIGLLNKDIPCCALQIEGKKFTLSMREPLPCEQKPFRKYIRIGFSVPKTNENILGFKREEVPYVESAGFNALELTVRQIIHGVVYNAR